MKKDVIAGSVVLLVLLFVMAGCNNATDKELLPPEPGAPSEVSEAPSGDLAGQGFKYVVSDLERDVYSSGLSSPFDVYADDPSNAQLFFVDDVETSGGTFSLPIRVKHPTPPYDANTHRFPQSLVYKKGWYLTKQGWQQFDFPQKGLRNSNWICIIPGELSSIPKESWPAEAALYNDCVQEASITLTLNSNDFAAGENYVYAYSCKKHGGVWRCGMEKRHDQGGQGSRWMVQSFNVMDANLPSEPGAPGSTASVCGDNVKAVTEQCDDGNKNDGDGCSAACTTESAAPACGDGAVSGPEVCDGKDNDCNGQPDDGLTAPDASKTSSVCIGAKRVCGGALGWQEPDYTKIAGYSARDICFNSIDDDCNGQPDDGCPVAVDSAGDVGLHSSIALDSNEKVHMSAYDPTNQDLRYCSNALGSWSCQTVDSEGNVGSYSSIAVDSKNKVHIAESDRTSLSLRYCSNALGSWSCQTVDNSGNVGMYSSIALDKNDAVHIAEYDSGNKNLRYCSNVLGSWSCQAVDSVVTASAYSSIAVDSNDKIHIAEYHSANQDLRYCSNALGSWSCQTVDSTGQVGMYSSIAVDSKNNVHISEYDTINGDLRYCSNALGSWACQAVDSTGQVGMYSSMAVDSNDKVHIVGFGDTNWDLHYCTNAAGGTSDFVCSDIIKMFPDRSLYLGRTNGRALAVKKGRLVDSAASSDYIHISLYNNGDLNYFAYRYK